MATQKVSPPTRRLSPSTTFAGWAKRASWAGYREVLRPRDAETVAPALLPDLTMSLADFWR